MGGAPRRFCTTPADFGMAVPSAPLVETPSGQTERRDRQCGEPTALPPWPLPDRTGTGAARPESLGSPLRVAQRLCQHGHRRIAARRGFFSRQA